jgi:hypothetical protein
MQATRLVPAFLFGAAIAAQSFTVSPSAYATQQGNASNPIPFYNANARYQQIHGDLKGAPKVIQAMAVRRGAGTQANAGPRSLQLTVVMANSDITKVTPTFAANYVGAPVTVMPKTSVNFPDWTTSGGNPEPWSIVLPFTTPFVYTGLNDLLWEWVVENNSGASQSYAADVYNGITPDMMSSTNTTIGTPCTATGQTRPMSYGPRCYTSRALGGLYFRGTALYGVPNQPALIMIGIVNPNLPVPGLCTNLYVLPQWSFPSIASASLGSFSMPDVLVPYDPTWQGQKLYSQALSLDTGQTGLPFALSAGIENVIPGMQPPGAAPIVRIFDINSAASSVGMVNFYAYGLIVRFTHP